MTFDDWRGADKISAKGRSAADRTKETRAIAARIAHARREAEGRNMARAGGRWARQIKAWHMADKIKGRE
jgi:hypothetical protein